MNFLNRFKFSALAGILLVVAFVSCEEEFTTIGEGVIGGDPFLTDKAVYDVTALNKKIEAVQTNQLPVYQLGVFNDPVYGKTEARITSQLQLSANNPTFGAFSQQAEDNGAGTAIPENETVTEVFLYIPYFNNQTDTDQDGVVDSLEDGDDITDPTNDTDGDGIPNNTENANNTDPNDTDTDNDGILDGDDDSTLGDRFAERFRLDSIYGDDLTAAFNLKVERSTFFLRDLDPNTNFQESQEYFSTQQFSPAFVDEVLYDSTIDDDGPIFISDEEILTEVEVDDPDTDANEIGTISRKRDPGIRVPLDAAFFQQNILNKEGASELLSASNFKEFMRGIHLSVTPSTEELLLLLDITNADIEIMYEHDVVDSDVKAEKTFTINLVTGGGGNPIFGNAVNTFINDEYPADILNRFDATVENAPRIHLKGGAGSYAEIQLFNEGDIAEIKANNWIINEANLVFHVDREGVTGSVEPPRLYLFNAETNAPLYNIQTENSTSDTPLGIYLNYDGILDDSDTNNLKYTVRITEYINNLVIRNSTNVKLGLSVSPDIRIVGANNVMLSGDLEKDIPAAPVLTPLSTVLHGNSSENEAKKLKLEIFYTQTN